MKKYLVLALISLSFLFLFADIASTTAGGNWFAASTWIGAQIPGADDNVIINGTVSVNNTAYCLNLTNSSAGILQNYTSNSYNLYVYGDLNNAGTIRNNTISSLFSLYSGGDIVNSGTFIPYSLNFVSTTDQHIFSTGTFSPTMLTDADPTSAIILLSDLSLTNSSVNLNNATLVLNSTAATSNLSMSGGSLKNATIQGGNGATLSLSNACFMQYISGDEIVLDGDTMIASEVIFDSVINYGEIFNYYNNTFTLTINERLENHGTIRNSTISGFLYLKLLSDLYDYGTIRNNTLYLSNTVQRVLWQDPSANPISSLFVLAQSTVILQLLSDLRFSGSDLNLNGKTLRLYNGETSYGLSSIGGKLRNGTLDTDGFSTLNLSGGVYLENLNAEDIILYGDLMFGANCSYNSLINHATIQNHSSNNYTLTINTLLENHGIIRNSVISSNLYLNLLGDLNNYNTISNNTLSFSNTEQRVLWQDPAAAPISSVIVKSTSSSDLQLLSDLHFSGSSIDLHTNALILYDDSGSYDLSLSGGRLYNGNLLTDEFSTLNFSGGVYIDNLSAGDIIIQGEVLIALNCSFNSLINHATIQNHSSNSYTLTINERLENHGIIRNSTISGFLYLTLLGDLYNYNTISNNTLSFSNTGQRVLWQDPAAAPISSAIVKSTSSNNLQLLSDLHFSGSNIDLHANALILYYDSGSYDLSLSGGRLYNGSLATDGYSTLNFSGGVYIDNLSAGDIIIQGEVMIAVNCSFNSLINHGTIKNYSNNSYTLTINTLLENHGITKNHESSGYLSLNLLGDLYDYGTISNYTLNFSNTGQSVVWQAPSADAISSVVVQSLSTGDFQLLSDLRFSGSNIILNGNTMLLYNGRSNYGISLSGGRLDNVYLDTAGFSTLDLSANAYLINVNAEDIIFRGEVSIATNCHFEDVVNYATIRNYSNNSYDLEINGNLINYGTIRNHPSSANLYLKSRKDLTNYGSIQNYQVLLNGITDQYILNTGTISVTSFQLLSEIGSAQWYYNGTTSGTPVLNKIIDPNTLGVWQPRTTTVDGRYITIGGGATDLPAPANLSIYFNLSELKLRWDQVSEAIYYNVYIASTPDGPYSFLGKTFDHDYGDGQVLTTLSHEDTPQFYKVTAGN
ncbi:MAG: hypothetical protein PHT37_05595 [Candidatus Cloacimonetes bacterium]|nr:hypothetical protein [Candidatus Cloacimonadota bacterium]